MRAFNLDDSAERYVFLTEFGTLKGRALANRLGLKGKGSTAIATALSCFAWNLRTAEYCHNIGHVETAIRYETIADRIYQESLKTLGWW